MLSAGAEKRMAKSKAVSDWLEARRRAVYGNMKELVDQIEVLDQIIQQAPTQTVQVHGRKWMVSTASQALIQQSDDAWRALYRVGQELREIESTISPKKGRPPNPSICASRRQLMSGFLLAHANRATGSSRSSSAARRIQKNRKTGPTF